LFQHTGQWQVTALQKGFLVAWWFALLAAPFAGSFLFVLVRRLPTACPALWGRSRCEGCGHTLGLLELVPIVSFLALRGRCRACGARVAAAHLAAELIALLIAAAVVATGAEGLELWAGCGLGWTLLALAWIDWEHFFLPDELTLPLGVAGLVLAWWNTPWTLTDQAVGAITAYLGFRLLAALYRALRKREGLGQGDAKLLAASGAWLGWQPLGDVVLLAALLGLGLALVARARGVSLSAATAVPFGPALALATFVLWLMQTWAGHYQLSGFGRLAGHV
jgi:leader peptidase (prepilin peptidase)/N-methyltransferase